jgi:hypothetical protein
VRRESSLIIKPFGLKGPNTIAQGKASERFELAAALGRRANKPSQR